LIPCKRRRLDKKTGASKSTWIFWFRKDFQKFNLKKNIRATSYFILLLLLLFSTAIHLFPDIFTLISCWYVSLCFLFPDAVSQVGSFSFILAYQFTRDSTGVEEEVEVRISMFNVLFV
jgi:hypothetical protein